MKHQAAPAMRRGRALSDEHFAPDFVRHAYILAIRRAADDAHQSVCDRDRDTVECDACREHTQLIKNAEHALNHSLQLP